MDSQISAKTHKIKFDHVFLLQLDQINQASAQVRRTLDEVAEVSDYVSARIDEIPDEYREQVIDGVNSFFDVS